MKVRCPNYNTAFHCLGGSCPDTCCRDWSVVPDEDALADYAAAPSPLRERIAQNLDTDDDGDVCFRLDEQGMCALLTPDGLCAIQRDWGEAHLCAHCAAYPRFIEEYGCLTETALAVSCPEAARLLREQPPIARKKHPSGQKNHVSFIRKPAFRPTEVYANSPNTKSQLLVCGATQTMLLG